MSWNLEDHILDHAALVSNNLPSYFNLADDKNIHFTFSVDKSQLIINHNCKSQKDIDIVMSKFFEDLKEYEYIFYESQGSKKPKCSSRFIRTGCRSDSDSFKVEIF